MSIKSLIGFMIAIAFSISIAAPSHAFIWMIYHKPAFKGKVIDAEAKESIEGAVLVIYIVISLKVLNVEDKI